MPAHGEHGLGHRGTHVDEHRIDLDRACQRESRHGADGRAQALRHRIGMGRVPQPGSGFEYALPLATLEAHLGGELTGLFAAVVELRRQRRVEEHHRLGGVEAVLGAAQGQHVDTRAPAQVGRRHPGQRRERVGETRTVHLHRHAVRMRHRTERCDFAPADRACPTRWVD